MMVVALKDITVTGPNSGLQINGLAHSATYASVQLFRLTADKPRGVAITWIACGKQSGAERTFFFTEKK